ncbi:MAG: T9SS type A sorting domain-containing protein [Flavobacteriales bacterium]|nr:T9SS type A sorting domain-containing protein [Flavobacteriales bacterium]
MKKLIPLSLLGLMTINANAQLVIDESDFPTAGESIIFGDDADVTDLTINIGTASASPQTWDFSMLLTDTLFTTGFYVPASVTGGSDFPTSDLAVDQFGGHAFADVSAGSVEILGLAADFGALLGLPVPFDAVIPAEDPWTIFTFPSSVGTEYDDVAVFDAKFPSDGLIPAIVVTLTGFDPDSIRFKRHITTASVIDAEGTLTDVLGGNHNVLRQNFNEFTVDSIWGWTQADGWEFGPNVPGFFPNPSISEFNRLRYISKALGYYVVQITLDDAGAPASATFKSDASQCCTSVEEIVARGENVVYPNPASDVLRVRTGGDIYTFDILDLSGRTVATHALTYDGQGVDVSSLSSGLYVYRMVSTDGRVAHSGRVSVVR